WAVSGVNAQKAVPAAPYTGENKELGFIALFPITRSTRVVIQARSSEDQVNLPVLQGQVMVIAGDTKFCLGEYGGGEVQLLVRVRPAHVPVADDGADWHDWNGGLRDWRSLEFEAD
ncbi:hypothetical protein B484DRAFT_409506, partial [Ochromonadaceae sp. CCMP2298]